MENMGFFNPFINGNKSAPGGNIDASDVSFDNSNTQLKATNVQDAIAELSQKTITSTLYFGTYMEFPTIGAEDILYVDKKTTYMYLWDSDRKVYVKQIYDINDYILQATL